MKPTYTIREVLNLIEGASVDEMTNLVKLLQEENALYSKAEHVVIIDHIIERRTELEKIANAKNN